MEKDIIGDILKDYTNAYPRLLKRVPIRLEDRYFIQCLYTVHGIVQVVFDVEVQDFIRIEYGNKVIDV
jgi:hypothetical protein